MFRNLFFSLFLIFGLGVSLSSCASGVYAGASVGAPYPYYGPRYYGYGPAYYGPRYYAPRPVIVAPRPYYGGGWHGGYHGGGYGGGGWHGRR